MRTCLFSLLALVAGCHWSLTSKSTDPESDQLYFPAGIAFDPNGQLAYVSNGNADLRYGGGTVMLVDMLSFECTVAQYRHDYPLVDSDTTTPLPAACTALASQQPAYWTDRGVRGLCKRNALDPSIVDCDESSFIFQNSTVRIGNFAGTIRVLDDPDPATRHRTLFVGVRGDPSIAEIQVHLPGGTPLDNPGFPGSAYEPPDLDSPGVLQCVASPSTLVTRPEYNPNASCPSHGVNDNAGTPCARTTSPAACDADFLVQDYYCTNQPTCTTGVNGNGKTQLPAEPFGMRIDRTRRRLVVSHLGTGQVSVIAIDAPPAQALLSESSPFFPPDVNGSHGAFGLAQQDPTDPHSLWYLTSNTNPLLATFRIADVNVVSSIATFALSNTFNMGTDVRDIIMDIGGNRAFVTQNNPPSVMVIDTRTDTTTGDQPHNLVTDVIDVCQEPSHMGVRRFLVPGAPGEPPYVKTKLVVVCFTSSQVMIVDPDRPGVDDTIFGGFNGPDDIAFNFSDATDPVPIADVGLPRHAYVTNYTDSNIAVIDLEPGSPTENRVLAHLGHPPDGFNP